MNRTLLLLAVTVAASSFTTLASAESATDDESSAEAEALPPPPVKSKPVHHDVSLTISPFLLALPVFQVTAEFRADDHVGLALVGGYGSVSVTTTDPMTDVAASATTSVSVWEIGGRANVYVVGDFDHGMQLGAQVEYVGGSTGGGTYQSAATAQGTSIGAYAGYKIATRVGFTFEGDFGLQDVFVNASTTDGTATASQSKVLPLVILNVGWSF